MEKKICLKSVYKDTAESLAQSKMVLSSGIIAYETDTNKIKICDGVHTYADLPYAGGECAGQDALEKEVKELRAEIEALKASTPIEPMTGDDVEKVMKQNGTIKLVQDTIVSKPIVTGVIATNDTTLNFNGCTMTIIPAKNGVACLLARGKSHYTLLGNGGMTEEGNVALVATGSENAIIDINGGLYESKGFECLYAENGTINVYGGVFKTTLEDKTYLLNCLDANYKAGTAKINVFGGKFYDFDPSNNASEGKGTNYVAEGYKVISSQEGEHTVYTVVKA